MDPIRPWAQSPKLLFHLCGLQLTANVLAATAATRQSPANASMATQLAIAAVFVVIPNLIGKVNRWRARSPGSLLMRLKPALPLQPIPPLRAVRGPYQPKEAPLQVRSPPPSQWIVITAIMVFVGYHIAQVRHARDLFTVTGLAADAPTAELRSKIAGMTLAEMGWRDTEANLERLLSRLGSIEGRVNHD